MAHETDNARIEFQLIKQEMTTANQVLKDIREQSREQIEQNEQLQEFLADINELKREIQEETDNLKRAKIETREEAKKIMETLKAARQMRQDISQDIESKVEHNVQQIVDSQMKRVETIIHQTIQKRGKITVDEVKLRMKEQIEGQSQAFEAGLTQRFKETFQEATSVLDQTTMQIGVEMEGAIVEFQNDLQHQVKILQTRAMNGIKPLIQELHEELKS